MGKNRVWKTLLWTTTLACDIIKTDKIKTTKMTNKRTIKITEKDYKKAKRDRDRVVKLKINIDKSHYYGKQRND